VPTTKDTAIVPFGSNLHGSTNTTFPPDLWLLRFALPLTVWLCG